MPGLQFHIACGCRTQYCRRDNARRVASWVFTPIMKEGDTDESDIDTYETGRDEAGGEVPKPNVLL